MNVSFDNVGPRPSSKHSIDRKNDEYGYFPGNVRWATASMAVGSFKSGGCYLEQPQIGALPLGHPK